MTAAELFQSVRDFRRHGVTLAEQRAIKARWAAMGIRNWFHALKVAREADDRMGGAL